MPDHYCVCCGKGITHAQWAFCRSCGYCDTGQCARDYPTIGETVNNGHWSYRYPMPQGEALRVYSGYTHTQYLVMLNQRFDIHVLEDESWKVVDIVTGEEKTVYPAIGGDCQICAEYRKKVMV